MDVQKVNLADKFALFSEPWSPKVVSALNDSYVKVVKLKGEFVWHHHEDDDELFLVIKGHLVIRLRDKDIHLDPGEFVVIPKMVEHMPVAAQEVEAVLIEPQSVVNTGNVTSERTVTPEFI